jgi:hypothetical protein
MGYIWIFPTIIIILGFAYIVVTLFMRQKETVPIGVPIIPIFWMIKKENHQTYSLAYFVYNIIISFIFIFAGFILLMEVL